MRELAIAILFVATGPGSAWAQAGGASSPTAHPGETAGEHIAVLEAPVGHRQPGMGDLPSRLRQRSLTVSRYLPFHSDHCGGKLPTW